MSRTRWLLCAVGVVTAGYGVAGLLTDPRGPGLPDQLRFGLTLVLVHDLVLAPLALGVGALVGRLAPTRLRGLLGAALFASCAVTVVALPLLVGRGRRPDVPSALPLDYRWGYLLTLLGIWGTAAVVGLARVAYHRPPPGHRSADVTFRRRCRSRTPRRPDPPPVAGDGTSP